MYGHQVSAAARSAPAPLMSGTGVGLVVQDYSSCWSALPSGIRQRIEPLLDINGKLGNSRRLPVAASR